jgi:hypothetical protein
MKNLFNNISQEEKSRILEMHTGKKTINENFGEFLLMTLGIHIFMKLFGRQILESILMSGLKLDDKTVFKKMFREFETNPNDYKLSYEKIDNSIDLHIDGNRSHIFKHRDNIKLPVNITIDSDGNVDLSYRINDGSNKTIKFNMGRKSYHRVEQIIDKYGENNSNDKN